MKLHYILSVILLANTVYNPAMVAANAQVMPAQVAIEKSEEAAVPLLSPKQLNVKMKELKNYLSRVRRCMVTGPCTQEEVRQVRRHALWLLKWLLITTAVGFLGWRTVKSLRQAQEKVARLEEEAERGLTGLTERTEELAEQVGGVISQAERVLGGGIEATGPGGLKLTIAPTQREVPSVAEQPPVAAPQKPITELQKRIHDRIVEAVGSHLISVEDSDDLFNRLAPLDLAVGKEASGIRLSRREIEAATRAVDEVQSIIDTKEEEQAEKEASVS